MKNDLTALNNYLFAQLEALTDEDMNEDQLQKEITRSEAVVHVAETVLRVGGLALRAREVAEDCGFYRGDKRQALPKMLEAE